MTDGFYLFLGKRNSLKQVGNIREDPGTSRQRLKACEVLKRCRNYHHKNMHTFVNNTVYIDPHSFSNDLFCNITSSLEAQQPPSGICIPSLVQYVMIAKCFTGKTAAKTRSCVHASGKSLVVNQVQRDEIRAYLQAFASLDFVQSSIFTWAKNFWVTFLRTLNLKTCG